jgi:hypothetical protein
MSDANEVAADAAPVPALPRRILDTVFSPGKMAADMARDPKWVGALLVSMILIAIATGLIPPELTAEVQRRIALSRGVTPPPMSEQALQIIRIVSIPLSAVFVALLGFVIAGVYTFIFVFVLGDEARYKQYLAVFAHAMFIPSLVSLALVPLRIQTGDPQFTLNVGSFLPFLDPGYLRNVLRFLDLTQLWSTAVIAMGAHAMDRRRSFGSALTIMLVISLVLALIFGAIVPAA